MKLMRAFSNFRANYLHPLKIWKKPNHVEILIYDITGSDLISEYITQYSFSKLATRGESINMRAVLRSMFKKKFWFGDSFTTYIEQYISYVMPKVLVTYIDNDPRFYEVSSKFPSIKTMFIQNGRRSELGDIFGSIRQNVKFRVDYMFVFGSAIGDKYKEYINGETISIGSFRNNAIPLDLENQEKFVLYISSWEKRSDGASFIQGKNGRSINWDDYFTAEETILHFLDKWCLNNGRSLKIAGRNQELAEEEEAFYSKFLNKCDWVYLPWVNFASTYEYIDAADIVVFIDSTCGLESLARGKKTVAFSLRGMILNSDSEAFGWPAKLAPNGLFWTSSSEEIDLLKVMDTVDSLDISSWHASTVIYRRLLMEFDPENMQFQKVLNSVLKQ